MKCKYNKIMLIDDNDIDNYIVSVLIKNNSIATEILEFKNGLTAFEYLELNKNIVENLPEIILLDIYMPSIDGFLFVEMLSERIPFLINKTKICVVSSSISDRDILKTKSDHRIFSFTSKPISNEFLISL